MLAIVYSNEIASAERTVWTVAFCHGVSLNFKTYVKMTEVRQGNKGMKLI